MVSCMFVISARILLCKECFASCVYLIVKTMMMDSFGCLDQKVV